jgi:hypothetical protein
MGNGIPHIWHARAVPGGDWETLTKGSWRHGLPPNPAKVVKYLFRCEMEACASCPQGSKFFTIEEALEIHNRYLHHPIWAAWVREKFPQLFNGDLVPNNASSSQQSKPRGKPIISQAIGIEPDRQVLINSTESNDEGTSAYSDDKFNPAAESDQNDDDEAFDSPVGKGKKRLRKWVEVYVLKQYFELGMG